MRRGTAFDRGLDDADEIRPAQLDRRNVHRDARGDYSLLQPVRVVAHGLLQCPSADFEDQARFLEQRDELERRYQAALGAHPPDQRLDADHAPGVGFDLGLVVQDELLSFERQAQLVLQGEAPRYPLCQLVRVEEIALVRFLCLLEGGLGVLEERVRVGAVVREH